MKYEVQSSDKDNAKGSQKKRQERVKIIMLHKQSASVHLSSERHHEWQEQ